MLKRIAVVLMWCALAGGAVAAQVPATPTIYITPSEDGFETYVVAALHKKKVPVTVVEAQDAAGYTLKMARVEVEKVSTGSKWAKCVFASCAGTEDKASVSVQLVKQGAIVWSYSVNKGRGSKNRQSMAEAIAKHLKDDDFRTARP